MRRGRRPDPSALRRSKGNPSKRPITDTPQAAPEPATIAQVPAPAELKHPGARRMWNKLAPTLAGLNFIQGTDHTAFARYCYYLGLWLELSAKVTVGSIVKRTKSEHVDMDRLDKRFQAILLLERRLQDLEDRFGLNPAARQALLNRQAGGRMPLFPQDNPQPLAGGEERPATPQPLGSSLGAARTHREQIRH